MAYTRSGRPTYYFEARTETGRKQLSTGTPNRMLARKIEDAWEQLALSHRARDLLGEVLAGVTQPLAQEPCFHRAQASGPADDVPRDDPVEIFDAGQGDLVLAAA